MLKLNIYFYILFSLQYFHEKRLISISMHKPGTCEILKAIKDDEALVMVCSGGRGHRDKCVLNRAGLSCCTSWFLLINRWWHCVCEWWILFNIDLKALTWNFCIKVDLPKILELITEVHVSPTIQWLVKNETNKTQKLLRSVCHYKIYTN